MWRLFDAPVWSPHWALLVNTVLVPTEPLPPKYCTTLRYDYKSEWAWERKCSYRARFRHSLLREHLSRLGGKNTSIKKNGSYIWRGFSRERSFRERQPVFLERESLKCSQYSAAILRVPSRCHMHLLHASLGSLLAWNWGLYSPYRPSYGDTWTAVLSQRLSCLRCLFLDADPSPRIFVPLRVAGVWLLLAPNAVWLSCGFFPHPDHFSEKNPLL